MTLTHVLYFAMPLALWLALRAVEPHRLFSRLYLASTLALIYFPTELVTGSGLWLIWMALIVDPASSTRQAAVATLLFSDRQRVLFHPLGLRGDWVPLECVSVERALADPHDTPDRMFLTFPAQHYCVAKAPSATDRR